MFIAHIHLYVSKLFTRVAQTDSSLAVDKIFSFSEPSPTLNIVVLFNVLQLKGCDTVSL